MHERSHRLGLRAFRLIPVSRRKMHDDEVFYPCLTRNAPGDLRCEMKSFIRPVDIFIHKIGLAIEGVRIVDEFNNPPDVIIRY